MNDRELIIVISHMTQEEASRIKDIFNSLEIPSFQSEYGKHKYYQISVERKDLMTARRVVAKHRAEVFVDSKKCPGCGGLRYKVIEKKGFWKKLLYMGTMLVRCNKCKYEFGI